MQSEKVRLTRGLFIEGKRYAAHQVVEVKVRHARWLRGIGAAVTHAEAEPEKAAPVQPSAPSDEAAAPVSDEVEGKVE